MADETGPVDLHGVMGVLQKSVIFDLKREATKLGLVSSATGQISVYDVGFARDNLNRKFTVAYDDGLKLDITITDESGAFIVDRGPYRDMPEDESDSPVA